MFPGLPSLDRVAWGDFPGFTGSMEPSDISSPSQVPPVSLGARYLRWVIQLAVRLVVEDSLPYRPASWHLWRDHRVFVPFGTIQNWVEAGGKKAHGQMDGAFLDWALELFSGSVAADELYEGPYCVLSVVDNRQYKRILRAPAACAHHSGVTSLAQTV